MASESTKPKGKRKSTESDHARHGNTNRLDQNTASPSLIEHVKENKQWSNDCRWLDIYLSRLSEERASKWFTPFAKAYRTSHSKATTNLHASKFVLDTQGARQLMTWLDEHHRYVKAVVICHADSCDLPHKVISKIWSRFDLDVGFLRQHLDHPDFDKERACRMSESSTAQTSKGTSDKGGSAFQTSIALPSETRSARLRLSKGSDCMSLVSANDSLIMLMRANRPCRADVKAQTTAESASVDSVVHRFLDNIPHIPDAGALTVSLIHSYSRVMLLEYYAEYLMDHDACPTPRIHCSSHDRANSFLAMRSKYRDLKAFSQELEAYCERFRREFSRRTSLEDHLRDAHILLSLYDDVTVDYRMWIEDSNQSNQAREFTAASESLQRLSRLGHLYLLTIVIFTAMRMTLPASIIALGNVMLAALTSPVQLFWEIISPVLLIAFVWYIFPSGPVDPSGSSETE